MKPFDSDSDYDEDYYDYDDDDCPYHNHEQSCGRNGISFFEFLFWKNLFGFGKDSSLLSDYLFYKIFGLDGSKEDDDY